MVVAMLHWARNTLAPTARVDAFYWLATRSASDGSMGKQAFQRMETRRKGLLDAQITIGRGFSCDGHEPQKVGALGQGCGHPQGGTHGIPVDSSDAHSSRKPDVPWPKAVKRLLPGCSHVEKTKSHCAYTIAFMAEARQASMVRRNGFKGNKGPRLHTLKTHRKPQSDRFGFVLQMAGG